MSSSMYFVTVESVAGPQVTLRVRTDHCDAGQPAESKTFPMNLLIDYWRALDEGWTYQLQGLEIEDEAAKALAQEAPWGTVMSKMKALSHGTEVAITEDEHNALSGGAQVARLAGKDIGGWGSTNGQYNVFLNGDYDELTEAVEPMVLSVEHDAHEQQEAYDNWPEYPDDATDEAVRAYYDKLPRLRMKVTLKDGALLGFLKPGVAFESTTWR